MRTKLLKLLLAVALGAVICLPGMAIAGIFLDFNEVNQGTVLNDLSLFTWDEGFSWTAKYIGPDYLNAVYSSDGAVISISTPNLFSFEGATFGSYRSYGGTRMSTWLKGATTITITGWNSGEVVQTMTLAGLVGIAYYPAEGFTDIDKLTFASDGGFVMDNFIDAVVVPLPSTVLLLGSGLLGLAGWRRFRKI